MKTQLLLVILASASNTFIQIEGAVSGERIVYFKLQGYVPGSGHGFWDFPTAFVKFGGVTTSAITSYFPKWPEVLHHTYRPGTGQVLRFELGKNDGLQRTSYDVIGTVDANLDELVRNGKGNFATSSGSGSLKITITNPISFKLKANNLPNADNWFDQAGRSDPSVRVYARNDQGARISVGESDVRLNTLDPVWPTVFKYLEYVPETGQKLYFKLYDHDWILEESLGEAAVLIDDLKKKQGATTLSLAESNGYATLTIQLV